MHYLHAQLHAANERVDLLEPLVHALVPEESRWDRLVREAKALAALVPNGGPLPPLYGVVTGIKDIIRADGWETRCGSALPPELFEGPEASCVTRLREAGALLLGKTVTTEFAYFEPGPTRNPRSLPPAPEHTPGGSSSGSAAAVAAGYCALALGSQTVGSVIRPAAYCGVVGFKPTQGRVPLDGVIPYAPSLDQLGWFTPDVAGALTAARVLVPDWREPGGNEPPVLGIPVGPYLEQAEAEGLESFHTQVERLRNAGFSVREVPVLADIAQINARHQALCCAELAEVHREWFPRYDSLYRPRTAAQIRAGGDVPPTELAEALAGRVALREQLHQKMEAVGVDLWLCPSAPGPAPAGLASTGNPVMNTPWTHAGLPVLSLPAGAASNGLPLGLQVVARHGADAALLAWAAGLEAALSG